MTILYTSTVNSEIFVEIFVPAKNIFAGTYVMFKWIILPGPFQVHAWKKKNKQQKNPTENKPHVSGISYQTQMSQYTHTKRKQQEEKNE